MNKTRVDNLLFLTGRSFYAVGLAALGIQGLIYADFRTQLIPDGWPVWVHRQHEWLYLSSLGLIVAGVLFLVGKWTKWTGLITGSILLMFCFGFHLPYQWFINPNDFHLGSYADALETLSLAGGAFMLVGSVSWVTTGRLLYCFNMTCYGICHFLYPQFISTMVPDWIPGHLFWTYFAGVALIGSGLAIAVNIWRRPIAMLQGLMIFLWLFMIHIPSAIADPLTDKGNIVASAVMALIFSGMSAMVAGRTAQPSPGWGDRAYPTK